MLSANVHVYHVENYKAKNLADILRQSYGETPSGLGIKEAKTKKGLTGFKSPGTSTTTAGDRHHYGRQYHSRRHHGRDHHGRQRHGRQFCLLGRGERRHLGKIPVRSERTGGAIQWQQGRD